MVTHIIDTRVSMHTFTCCAGWNVHGTDALVYYVPIYRPGSLVASYAPYSPMLAAVTGSVCTRLTQYLCSFVPD